MGATPPACPVCGGRETTKMVSAIGERAYCSACFHGWRTEHPVYAYDQTAMCPLGTAPERLQGQVDMFAPFTPSGAAILEIGCATGELAAVARVRLSPARYEGIELSPAGETARPRLDRLHTRTLPQLLASGDISGPFDLIVMSHVLEHLADPRAELTAMKRVLAPGGAIFLEVPNGGGHRRLPIDDNRSHLHFFSLASLVRLLAGEGLETIAAATDARLDARYADSLRLVARSFALPKWSPTLLSDHPALEGENAIVVWGAGGLAEEVLANYFDPARIDFFIDRDPAKQSGAMLGRAVRGPEALGAAARTVLITSIDFAGAIAADIEAMYPGAGHRIVRVGDLLDA
ncbi:MAG: class I SAM-dependent methyltransferase [Caulobacteraceae bacterium]